MKKTLKLKRWIRYKVSFYCRVLKVENPKITYKMKDVIHLSNGEIIRASKYEKDTLAWYNTLNQMWFNISEHHSKKQLEKTIIHECCHIIHFEHNKNHSRLTELLIKRYM